MRELEIIIIGMLGYRLRLYTPYDFLMMFFTYGIIASNDSFCTDSTLPSSINGKSLNTPTELNLIFSNPNVIEEVYQFCEQVLNLVLEGTFNLLF